MVISFLGALCFGVLGAFLSGIAPLPGLFVRVESKNGYAMIALVGSAVILPIAAAVGGCAAFVGFFVGYRRVWLRWTLLLLVPAIFAAVPFVLFDQGARHF